MSEPPAPSRPHPPQQAMQEARAARLAVEVPREPSAPLRFASTRKLEEHVVKHVFHEHHGAWWHRSIGRELIRRARDAPTLAWRREVPDEAAAPPSPTEVRAARESFREVSAAYETLIADRLIGACTSGKRHAHLLSIDYDADWRIAGSWQRILAWDPDGNLVIIAGSSVTQAGAEPFILQTGHRRHPRMDRGTFLKDSRRWAREHARETGQALLAMHDDAEPRSKRAAGNGAT